MKNAEFPHYTWVNRHNDAKLKSNKCLAVATIYKIMKNINLWKLKKNLKSTQFMKTQEKSKQYSICENSRKIQRVRVKINKTKV